MIASVALEHYDERQAGRRGARRGDTRTPTQGPGLRGAHDAALSSVLGLDPTRSTEFSRSQHRNQFSPALESPFHAELFYCPPSPYVRSPGFAEAHRTRTAEDQRTGSTLRGQYRCRDGFAACVG